MKCCQNCLMDETAQGFQITKEGCNFCDSFSNRIKKISYPKKIILKHPNQIIMGNTMQLLVLAVG